MCSRPALQVWKGEATELPALFCESGGYPTPPAGLLCSVDPPPGRPSNGTWVVVGGEALAPSSPRLHVKVAEGDGLTTWGTPRRGNGR